MSLFKNNYVEIDTSTEPLVLITYSSAEPTLAEFDAYLREIEIIYERVPYCAFVLDSTRVKYLRSELRIKQGTWMKENEKLIGVKQKGAAFVVNGVMVQMLLQGIMLVNPFPAPYKVFAKYEEALQWATNQLKMQK
ncbi:MAG: hypothetical protein EAZ57_05115 [Cytophagales bacterium]|nr:MAG: hypothetical protein EAZ67_06465 [Cytophagales bacterium]TAF60932.1 MAG: hypothetical protein EAZ57_05115 [Cytophagales bacterium]